MAVWKKLFMSVHLYGHHFWTCLSILGKIQIVIITYVEVMQQIYVSSDNINNLDFV